MSKLINFFKRIFFFSSLLFSSCNNFKIENNFSSIFELSIGNSQDDILGYATSFKLKDDLCITNAHNVVFKNESNKYEPYKYIEGKIYNSNEKIIFEVDSFSYEDDYAKISPIENSKSLFNNIKCLPYNLANEYTIGEKCYCIGNLNNYGLSYNEGVISSKLKKIEYHEKENYFIQTSIEISKGVSGCPLFNSNNEVIGIMTFKLRDSSFEYIDGLSFAIPIAKIFEN